jgi:hypothetical protein
MTDPLAARRPGVRSLARAASTPAILCFVAAALAAGTCATPARADPADECIAAAEQSQPLRRDAKLRAARQKLIVCSRPECPSVVRSDCVKWLADVETLTPTIVVRAVDSSGVDVVGTRVFVDGELQEARLEGKEMEIDPGTHTLRVEHDGSTPVEQQIVVREAEHHRMVSVSFAPATPQTTAAPGPSEVPAASSRSLVLPIVLVAAGGVGVGVASYLWASGLSDRSDMQSSCAKTSSCPQSRIDSARGKLIAGDVVGGVGVVAAAVGVGLLVFGRSSTPQTTQIGLEPLAGGGYVGMRGSF